MKSAAGGSLDSQRKAFFEFHSMQFYQNQIPITAEMIDLLFRKFSDQVYDSSEFMQIIDNQEEEVFQLKATQPLKAFGNVFLIDHALSFK